MKNFRDIEQLSSYLDGQLSPSDSARPESRLASDPELASAFNDIRAARSILRKLPARKAPRNFTLTRQMVGLKPPLPRSYSFFRFSTTFATLLLTLTFAVNLITPRLSYVGPNTGWGGGYGGGPAAPQAAAPEIMQVPAATEAPVATEAPAAMAPAATESLSMDTAIFPTQTQSLSAGNADSAPEGESMPAEEPTAKEAGTPPESQEQLRVGAEREALIPSSWQIGLLVIGLVSLLMMLALRRSAIQKWK